MKKYDIYGLGNAVMDLQFIVEDDLLDHLDLVKGGMQLIDLDRKLGLLNLMGQNVTNCTSGGSMANSIIAAQQMGAQCAFSARVGCDNMGNAYVEGMQKCGVSWIESERGPGPTGHCLVMITPDFQRTMCTYLGESALFSAREVSTETIALSKWIFVEGYLLTNENGRKGVEKALQSANLHGVPLALTLSDSFVVDLARDFFAKHLSSFELVFGNIKEARVYSGRNKLEEIVSLLRSKVAKVAITDGPRGALLDFDGKRFKVDSPKVREVDSTGAGDAFAGVFLSHFIQGMDVEKAASQACQRASQVVAQMGSRLQNLSK